MLLRYYATDGHPAALSNDNALCTSRLDGIDGYLMNLVSRDDWYAWPAFDSRAW